MRNAYIFLLQDEDGMHYVLGGFTGGNHRSSGRVHRIAQIDVKWIEIEGGL